MSLFVFRYPSENPFFDKNTLFQNPFRLSRPMKYAVWSMNKQIGHMLLKEFSHFINMRLGNIFIHCYLIQSVTLEEYNKHLLIWRTWTNIFAICMIIWFRRRLTCSGAGRKISYINITIICKVANSLSFTNWKDYINRTQMFMWQLLYWYINELMHQSIEKQHNMRMDLRMQSMMNSGKTRHSDKKHQRHCNK